MKKSPVTRPGIHFTKDHAWIDVNGTVGFVGVSHFKLSGLQKIDAIRWTRSNGTLMKGTLVASIHAGDEIIPIHAPLNCKFLGPNAKLKQNPNIILESPQDQGWLFFVQPLKFLNSDKAELLAPEEYQKMVKRPKASTLVKQA